MALKPNRIPPTLISLSFSTRKFQDPTTSKSLADLKENQRIFRVAATVKGGETGDA